MRRLALMIATAAVALAAPAASAAPTLKKSIWGPTSLNGQSQFPVYADLGVGLYQTTLDWRAVAPTRPAKPADYADPAYRWPAELDAAITEAAQYGIAVSVTVMWTPGWANGGLAASRAPGNPADFGRFLAAAAARYPKVRHWLIWGEPSKRANFVPPGAPTGARYRLAAPRHYARLLQSAYTTLKRANARNLVIGGNTWTVGNVRPLTFLRNMKLPNGRRPRMDLYGHNPFSTRKPDLALDATSPGLVDFSELDTLARNIDRYLGRDSRGRRLRIFLSEYTVPSDHANWEFNFWVSREVQAGWLAAALRITRKWSRIYTLGWLALTDDPRRPEGDEVNRGLLDARGRKKPSYFAYRDG